MSRRALVIILFLLFAGGVVWYASAHVRVPEMTFAEAGKVGDSKKKVMVVGKVVKKDEIASADGAVTFFMTDSENAELKISYSGEDQLTTGQLAKAAESGSKVSVAGHSHGDYFHATDVYFPAY